MFLRVLFDHGDNERREQWAGLLAGVPAGRPVNPPPYLAASVVRYGFLKRKAIHRDGLSYEPVASVTWALLFPGPLFRECARRRDLEQPALPQTSRASGDVRPPVDPADRAGDAVQLHELSSTSIHSSSSTSETPSRGMVTVLERTSVRNRPFGAMSPRSAQNEWGRPAEVEVPAATRSYTSWSK